MQLNLIKILKVFLNKLEFNFKQKLIINKIDIIIVGSGECECYILMKLNQSSISSNIITIWTIFNVYMNHYSSFYLIENFEIHTLMKTYLFTNE